MTPNPWKALPLLCVAALTLLATGSAAQEPSHRELTFKASENCADDREYCFEVTEGNAAEIQAGDHLMITFINQGSQSHNLYVTTVQKRDAERRDTSTDGAIGQSKASVAPGSMEEFDAPVPADADGVYFWCDIPGHEGLGMWWEETFGGAQALGGQDPTDRPENDEVSPARTPLPPWLGLAALAMAAVAARRRGV